ncbi:dTMP kinase [Changpingibacter yushuensis]|uniref:dTMP kinase n=1 Tax=Changpingibacter yushuensis TaxID=2758440 RepID=UPI0015F661A9|nr:hypothetical protein [Changpingibacter yushuensis]
MDSMKEKVAHALQDEADVVSLAAELVEVFKGSGQRRVRSRVHGLSADEAVSLLNEAFVWFLHRARTDRTYLDGISDVMSVLVIRAQQEGWRYVHERSSIVSGTSGQLWRQREIIKTRTALLERGAPFTRDDLIEQTNARLATQRKDFARQGMRVSPVDVAMLYGVRELDSERASNVDELSVAEIVHDTGGQGIFGEFMSWYVQACMDVGIKPSPEDRKVWAAAHSLSPAQCSEMARLADQKLERYAGQGMGRGLFIAVEGVRGAGLTTQVRQIHKLVHSWRRECVVVRLRSPRARISTPSSRVLSWALSVAEVSEVVRDGLDNGAVVIADRFTASVEAFGESEGFDLDDVRSISRFAGTNLVPDATILLDAPDVPGEQDTDGWARGTYRFLSEDPTWFCVDASRPVPEVTREVEAIVARVCGRDMSIPHTTRA